MTIPFFVFSMSDAVAGHTPVVLGRGLPREQSNECGLVSPRGLVLWLLRRGVVDP